MSLVFVIIVLSFISGRMRVNISGKIPVGQDMKFRTGSVYMVINKQMPILHFFLDDKDSLIV